jgi:hypothetical protein
LSVILTILRVFLPGKPLTRRIVFPIQEFGLTQEEIFAAMRAGKLQFRECSMHGNPWFRLLRHEVESLVRNKGGLDHLHKKKLEKELADLNKEARKITTRLKAIERRQTELKKELDG